MILFMGTSLAFGPRRISPGKRKKFYQIHLAKSIAISRESGVIQVKIRKNKYKILFSFNTL